MPPQATKRCSRCGRIFPATREFFNARTDSKDGLRGYCRECHVQYARDWNQANPERAAEHTRAKAARQRERRREVLLKRTRMWRKKNKAYIRRYNRTYRIENDAEIRALRASQRAQERNMPDDFTAEDWRFALEYFGEHCAVCGRPFDGKSTVAADHWIPLSDPDCPGTIPANIVPLCCGKDGCNEKKGHNNPDAWVVEVYGIEHGNKILEQIRQFFLVARQPTS